jgi:Tol biopolymer transport system component
MLAFLIATAVAADMLMLDVNCRIEPLTAAGEGANMFHGLSPDGRELAVGWERGEGASRQRGAFILDLRTGKRTPLPQLNNAASFSPDGRYLVAANYSIDLKLKTEVVELDRRTGETKTYASDPATEWLASYSSDGKWILFNSMRTGNSDLYRVKRATGKVERVTDGANYEAHGKYFDRDRQILFHRNVRGEDYDVAILDTLTGRSRAIGATPLEEAYPAMSPDGRWIAFSAVDTAGEQPNLYVMRRDGSGKYRLTDGPDKDAYSTWSRDGRAIYFVRFAKDGGRIYRIRMKNGACAR